MDRLTDQEISDALEICEKATPGPWKDTEDPHHFSYHEREGRTYAIYGNGVKIADAVRPSDAHLAAASRTLLLRALKEIQELRSHLPVLDRAKRGGL